MPAYVRTAAYVDRSARVICDDCALDDAYIRTATAQDVAREHNAREHAYPDPLPIDTEETA